MSNFDTITAVTDNLESVLRGLGLKFTQEIYDDVSAIPASLLPHGQIFYDKEVFEYTHGQKPEYATVSFRIRVALTGRDARKFIRDQQNWVHKIREALTVNALNIGGLAASKLINVVSLDEVDVENTADRASLMCRVGVRYREV